MGEQATAALNSTVHLPVSPRKAGVGDSVKLKSLGKTGVVRSKSGDSLEVEVGLLRTRVTLDDVEEVIPARAQVAAPQAARVHVTLEPVTHGSLSEINVIGDTADEARRRVDKFLDNAYLASLSRVRVIHGSGNSTRCCETLKSAPSRSCANFLPKHHGRCVRRR